MNIGNFILRASIAVVMSVLPLAACSSGDDSQSNAGTGGTGGAGSGGGGTGGSGGGGTGGNPDAGAWDPNKKGDANVLVGAFTITMVPETAAIGTSPATAAHTSIIGRVSDGPTPPSPIWNTDQEEGDCRLIVADVPFCDPACAAGKAVCVDEEKNTCQPYPAPKTVGKVLVKGLKTASGDAEIALTEVNDTYQNVESLLYPAFFEGDDITVSAEGSDFTAAFSLSAKGIAPLELLNETITIAEQDITLTWTLPGQAGISKIHVKLDIAHHGSTGARIVCDTDDIGSLTISAAMLKALVAIGVAGYPSVVVTRSSTGSAVISAGRVDLTVSSEVEKIVEIPGLTSCNDDTDCPTGQTCQNDLTCK